ncbi:hypothetical protein VTO42DRAFT_1880 [Malbranchea cinnamomea]
MAHAVSPRNQTLVDRIGTSRSMRDTPLPPLQTELSDLTHSADLSDTVASNLTPTTSSSICSVNDPTSRPPSLSQIPPKMPAPRPPDADSAPVQPSKTRSTTQTPPRSPSNTSTKLDAPIQLAQGLKRTASGETKPSASAERLRAPGTALAAARSPGRQTRAMSTDSNASRIAEVSALLHSRLSYAAAKLESQWQMRSSESRQNGAARSHSPPPPSHLSGSAQSFHHTSRETPVSSDSFVRNRSYSTSSAQNGGSLRPSAALDMSHIPQLAPPVDIIAGNKGIPRHLPNPNSTHHNPNIAPFKSPFATLHKPSLSRQSSASSNHTGFHIPDTPPYSQQQQQQQQPHSSSQQTPATAAGFPKRHTPFQNALMEQDAIETLLFLSSPENSGYRANSQSTQQNHASDFSSLSSTLMQPRAQPSSPRLETTSEGRTDQRLTTFGNGDSIRPTSPATLTSNVCHTHNNILRGRTGPRLLSGDAIDRMLDEMQDSDSDEDAEWISRLHQHVNNLSHRRREAGPGDWKDSSSSLQR